jgi:hypothetical protein
MEYLHGRAGIKPRMISCEMKYHIKKSVVANLATFDELFYSDGF